MKRKSLIAAAAILGYAAVMATTAQAGGKAVVPIVPMNPPAGMPLDNLLDPIETTLSSGYMSQYNFRGANIGRNAIWTGLNFAMPVGLPVGDYVANFGVWYINPTDPVSGVLNPVGRDVANGGFDDEIDYYASLGATVGAFDVSVGWTHYSYEESSNTSGGGRGPGLEIGDQDEVGVNIGTSVGMFDLGVGYYYNLDAGRENYLERANNGDSLLGGTIDDVISLVPPNFNFDGGEEPGFVEDAYLANTLGDLAHYIEVTIGTSWDISDRVGLSIGAAAGWFSDQFSHVDYTASLPVQIAGNVVFEPYLSWLDDTSSGTLLRDYKGGRSNDNFSAGVSLSVSF